MAAEAAGSEVDIVDIVEVAEAAAGIAVGIVAAATQPGKEG